MSWSDSLVLLTLVFKMADELLVMMRSRMLLSSRVGSSTS